MKAYVIESYGHVPLKCVDMPMPVLNEHDLLVEIHAAAVNPVDFKIRNGDARLLLKYRMPLIMGNDMAGVVTQVGAKVTRFKPGDEVYARPPKNRIGTFAEFIAIHEDAVAIKPESLSFEEAASIPLVGLTAWQALHDIVKLQSGQKILIHAGAGGVGTLAIQLAKACGAFVATTVSEAGRALVESLGADRIIDYRTERFDRMLSGYDAVFDTVGGQGLNRSFRILRKGGQIVSVSGIPNRRFAKDYGLGIFMQALLALSAMGISGLERRYDVRYTYLFMNASGEQLRAIGELVDAGKVRAVIDSVFPFEEAQAALDHCERGRAKGKIVIRIK